jgi:hypothetical protein
MGCSCSNTSQSYQNPSCPVPCQTNACACGGCNNNNNLPLVVYQGASFAPIIRLQDQNGIPIDTTPYTDIEVDVPGIPPAACVAVKFSLTQVTKVSPFSSGQIQPMFTSVMTALFGLTDPTQAAACSYTPLVVKLTNPSDPTSNPYVLVIPNALNILAAGC